MAFGCAEFTGQGQLVAGTKLRIKGEEVRIGAFVGPRNLVVDPVLGARYPGEIRLHQRIVSDHIACVGCLACSCVNEMRAPEQVIAVVVGGIQLRTERAEIQRECIAGFYLYIDQTAIAFAFLFEQRRTQQHRIVDAGKIRASKGNPGPGCDLFIAQYFDTVAAQMAFFRKTLQQHARRIGVVFPVQQCAHLRIRLARQHRTHGTDRRFKGQRLAEFERLAGNDVD